ncbi:MAG: 1-phosphofructokinase family hexose kinase [Propionicimonas sp.]
MLAICPNPTIDRLVILDSLEPGTVQRVRANRAYPAGKSVSAARGCLANGASPQVLALLPTVGADWYLATLRAEGMDVTAHPCAGAVRESIIVIEDAGRVSVLNGPGAPVTAETWDAFAQAATAGLSAGQWVICSGSFPPGVGPEALAGLVAAIAATGARLALDTGPAWMPLALHGPALPTLITPNLAEAEAILTGETTPEETGVVTDALARAAAAAAGLHERGVEAVVVTAGSEGLAWATRDGAGALVGQPVAVSNPIGAGDAFLGGLVSRLEAGLPFVEAAAWGMATSCAAIEQWAPGGARAGRVAHFHRLITGA